MEFTFAVENYYLNIFYFQATIMSIGYLIYFIRNNGSMVDFCWPLGFTIMAIQFLFSGKGIINIFLNIF